MSKKDKVVRTIKTIPINEIRFLNPRVRNRRNFQEIVQSIAKVGLKRPITVSPRKTEADSASYDLACGQGRIEAFIQLGQTEIPAIVIEAEESDKRQRELQENLVGIDPNVIASFDEAQHSAVRDRDSFRCAGRSRGVHDVG